MTTADCVLTDQTVLNALFADPGHLVLEVAQPATIHTSISLLELGRRTDGRICSCNASSESVGLMGFRGTSKHAGCFVVEVIGVADPLTDSISIEVLAKWAWVDLGASGLRNGVELIPFDAVETVVG